MISHDVLKRIIRRKIKDKKLLNLIDENIDSINTVINDPQYQHFVEEYKLVKGKGIPIGNYTSSYYANLCLSELDHLCKEELKCKFYFRYADDIVIFSNNKEFLRKVLIYIKLYLSTIGLEVKHNYQIFPVDSRGVDFVGYVFYHTHTLLRKSIKINIKKVVYLYVNKKINKKKFLIKMSSYFGWLKYANTKHFLQWIEKVTGIRYSNFIGKEVKISNFYNKRIRVIELIIKNKYYIIHFTRNGISYSCKSIDTTLFYSIVKHNHYPLTIKLIKYNFRLYCKNKAKQKSATNVVQLIE